MFGAIESKTAGCGVLTIAMVNSRLPGMTNSHAVNTVYHRIIDTDHLPTACRHLCAIPVIGQLLSRRVRGH